MSERDIFMAAIQKENPTERQAYLDAACGHDAALRKRLEGLLQVHGEAGSFLEKPPVNAEGTWDFSPGNEGAARAAAPPDVAGTVIGPYKVLQQLGEGGMGTVFLAEQTEPVQRKVALKVIKPGMDSRDVIARFEAERQALALMDHPNIARVLDGGATPDGRPYFVMELVRGVPITRYCDEHRLTPRERLQLFVPVCQAVQHAHQKGVIHRDIKPSNVLVTQYDGQPVVKVIDFGVAKAAGRPLTDRTLVTGLGAVVGTPEYMSPEQAGLGGLDIDTRSDVYSLGVLLYELLTGSTPLGAPRTGGTAILEVLRKVREEEPPRPSLRLGASEELPVIAASRETEPARLVRQVRGELDWIVMKCLEKDRNRRYETANGLAMDLERHLHDEPVLAGPPSAAYRLRKFARKYRNVLATAAAFALLLITGAVVSAWQAVLARQAEVKARTAEEQARASEEMVKIEAAIGQTAHLFIQEDLLGQADVEMQIKEGWQPERDITVRTLLDRAAQRVEGRFQDPLVEASIRLTLGNAYRAVGEHTKAVAQLEKALAIRRRHLPIEHPDTLTAINSLAYLYLVAPQLSPNRRPEQAERLLTEALEVSQRVLGEEHPITLTALHNLTLLEKPAKEQEPRLKRLVEVRRRTLGEDHRDTLRAMNNLALLYWGQGDAARAVPLFEKTLEGCRRTLGREHPLALLCMSNLAALHKQLGDEEQAEQLWRQAVEGARRVLGPGHPSTISSSRHLVELYLARRQYAKAEPLIIEVRTISRGRSGREDRDFDGVIIRGSLGEVFKGQGGLTLVEQKKYAEAEPVLRDLLTNDLRDDTWFRSQVQSLLGACLAGQKRYAEAEPFLLRGYEGLKTHEAAIPAAHRKRLGEALERVVGLYDAWGRPERAAEWGKQLDDEKRAQARQEEARTRIDRGKALVRLGKLAEAEADFREAARLRPEDVQAQRALGEFLCYQKHDFDGAVAAFREVVRLQPNDAASRHDLGNALTRQGKAAEEGVGRAPAKASTPAAEAAAEYREALRLRPGAEEALRREALLTAEETEVREALRRNPQSADAHCDLGNFLLKKHRYLLRAGREVRKEAEETLTRAEAVFRTALRLKPDLAAAHVGLGNALRGGLGIAFVPEANRAEAEKAFREALRQKPDYAEAHAGLGAVLTSSRPASLIEAEATLREALRLRPDLGEAYTGLAIVLTRKARETKTGQGRAEAGARQAASEAELKEAVRRNPKDAAARARLGDSLARANRWDEAEAEYREAVRLEPDSSSAHAGIARVLSQQGDLAAAAESFREALRQKPDDPEVHADLAGVLARLDRPAEAAAEYREAVRLRPDHERTRGSLVELLMKQDRPAEAEAVRREAVRQKPDDPQAHSLLGTFLQRQGKWADAEAAYKEALRLKPGDRFGAHAGLVAVLAKQNKPADVEAVYREIVRLRPDSPEAHSRLGSVLLEQGKAAEAVAECREALRLAPDAAEAHKELGNALSRQAEAEAEARAAVRLKPDYAAAHVKLGSDYRWQGLLGAAEAEFREAIRKKPDHTPAHVNLGALLDGDRDDRDGAVAALREAVRLVPTNPWHRCHLAWALLRQDKPAEAEAEARTALRRSPAPGEAHVCLGSALARQGKWAEAEAAFREAALSLPDDDDIHDSLAGVLRQQGKTEEAAAALREALAIRQGLKDAYRYVGHLVVHSVETPEPKRAAYYRDRVRRRPYSAAVHYDLGHLLLGQEKPAEAEVVLRAVARLRPDHAEAHKDLAAALAAQGKPAEPAPREAAPLKPDETAVHYYRGWFLAQEKGNLSRAEAAYKEALRLRPDYPAARTGLIRVLTREGKLSEVEALYRDAVRARPDDAVAHVQFGNFLLEQGKLADAETAFREALRLKPDDLTARTGLGNVLVKKDGKPGEDADAHYNRGLALERNGKRPEALAAFKEAVRQKPDWTAARHKLADLLRLEGKPDEAEAEYREAARLQPDDAHAHYILGVNLLNRGKAADAEVELREAIRLQPDHAWAHRYLGDIFSQQGKRPEAIAEYRAAVRFQPENIWHHVTLGNSLGGQGNLKEAEAAFREAVARLPKDAVAHFYLGNILSQQGKLKEAESAYEEAVRLQPDHAAAQQSLSRVRGQMKQAEEEAEYREAIRKKPDDVAARNSLAQVLSRQNKWAEATDEYREVARLKPQDPVAHYNLGSALAQQGKLPEAEAALLESLRLREKHVGAHQALGSVYARSGKWDKAAAALARSLELVPGNSFAWMQRATLLLQAGDGEGYRRVCRDMLQRFGKTDQPYVAEQVARACLLAPDVVADREPLLKLADVASDGGQKQGNPRYFLPVKALSEYRAGRFAAAAEALGQFKPQAGGTSQDALAFAVLALAEHRLGRDKEARAALAESRAILVKKMPDFGKGQSLGQDWHDWLHGQVLCREAEESLKKAAEEKQEEPRGK